MDKLKKSRVAVFGVGGVGGYVVEALARSGVGKIDLIDDDKISVTNINRQIMATVSTVGQYKVDVAKKRILDINPECEVNTFKTFYLPETEGEFDFTTYDYIVDAIDTVTAKLRLIENADSVKTPIISCMGTGNKLDGTAFEVTDIHKTSACPLARVMRKELKKRGVKKCKVLYSTELAMRPVEDITALIEAERCANDTGRGIGSRRDVPGSVAFVPGVAGLIIAGEVVKDLTVKEREEALNNHKQIPAKDGDEE